MRDLSPVSSSITLNIARHDTSKVRKFSALRMLFMTGDISHIRSSISIINDPLPIVR